MIHARPGVVLILLGCALLACGGKRSSSPAEPAPELERPGPKTRPRPATDESERTKRARLAMVRDQIEARGIRDAAVLAAMRKVPRHLYVPDNQRAYAYVDDPLPIGQAQTISQPYIVAFMTEALKLKGTEKVLEIGTGSGYQAAVLAEIVKSVYTIEIVKPLAKRAAKTLKAQGHENVHPRTGDGYRGWPEQAPFDAVIVTAAPDHVPQPLLDQLRVGGRMIVPVGKFFQELILLEKTERGIERRSVLPVRFVPMTGEALQKKK